MKVNDFRKGHTLHREGVKRKSFKGNCRFSFFLGICVQELPVEKKNAKYP